MAASAKSLEGRPTPKPQPGLMFRAAIEKAQADGVDPSALLLKLTLGDVARLKRDPTISTADISFSGGEMRYLGVKVAQGQVEASALVILQA
jgi:hypothetical protein